MKTRRWQAVAVVAVGLALGTAGCTDTTVAPQSSMTGSNAFVDPRSYQMFLARIYSGLAVSGQQGPAGNGDIAGIDEGFSQYLRLYWEHQELPTDEAGLGWGGDAGLDELIKGTFSSSNTFVNAMYYRIFFQIGLANQFLRETSDAKLATRNVNAALRDTIQTYRAEARFLRALSYWHGLDLMGNIPMLTEADPLGTSPKQATRQQIYNFLVSELTAIKSQLPTQNTYGRATPAAAAMLLAKVQMNAAVYLGAQPGQMGTAHWTDAMTALNDVLSAGYTLDPKWRRIFSADNDKSPEIIFTIPQDGLRTQSYGAVTFLIHASVGGSMDPSAYGISSGGWWGIRMKPEAYNNYTAGDKRASFFWTDGQTVAMTGLYNFNNGIPAPKFTNMTSDNPPQKGSDSYFVDTDFPVFRLSDAYLMYAELVLRGGGGSRGQALSYVNQIRERAGLPDWSDAQLTLDNILAERGRELLFEGYRRQDLIRFGKFTGGSYIWSWKGGTLAGGTTPDFRALYPLPANELVANPNLKQNTGY